MKKLFILLLACIVAGGGTSYVHKVKPVEGDATASIQKQLDKCFLSGGGKVVLQKGVYHVGGLRIWSNTTLYLKSGAELLGSRDCDDYRLVVTAGPDRRLRDKVTIIGSAAASAWNDAIIRIYDAENVAVIGEPGSVIDGANSYNPTGEQQFRGAHGFSVHKCRNLTFKGYTIRNTGNWAHSVWQCRNVTFEDLTILGGFDGVHVRACDSVRIASCTMQTGDDCIAGFDNRWVSVTDCSLNSSCSAFRFGGTHVHVDRCRCYGPGLFPSRGSLTQEQKVAGAMAGPDEGRKNMLCVFTYFATETMKIREKPADMVITDLECENVDRFLHYNFSGSERWQAGMPMDSLVFRNVRASGIKLPLCAYSAESAPFNLELRNVSISFRAEIPEFIRGANIGTLLMHDVHVEGAGKVPAVRIWAGNPPVLDTEDVTGVDLGTATSDQPFRVSGI